MTSVILTCQFFYLSHCCQIHFKVEFELWYIILQETRLHNACIMSSEQVIECWNWHRMLKYLFSFLLLLFFKCSHEIHFGVLQDIIALSRPNFVALDIKCYCIIRFVLQTRTLSFCCDSSFFRTVIENKKENQYFNIQWPVQMKWCTHLESGIDVALLINVIPLLKILTSEF